MVATASRAIRSTAEMMKTVPATSAVGLKPQIDEATPGVVFGKADLVVFHVDPGDGSFGFDPSSGNDHPELYLHTELELVRFAYVVLATRDSLIHHGGVEVHLAGPLDPVVPAPDLDPRLESRGHTEVRQVE